MPQDGTITLSIEKLNPWYVKYLPQILTVVLIASIIILLYFLYKIIQRKKIEKELARAAVKHEPAIIKKKKRKRKKEKIEVVELPAEKAEIPPTDMREAVEHKSSYKIEEIEKHLKEDERTVINILKQKEGSAEQGTLRVVSGFPKSTLSRILKELEDRKIIYKEKRGKKNLVFLKK